MITAKNSQAQSQDRLRIQTGTTFIYDDNVWQFSDSDRQAFKDNPNQSLFQNTESLDDLIWQPFIHLQFRLPWREGGTQLFGKVTGTFYTRNTDLNYQTYRIGIRQEIGKDILASATYTVTPNLFVGKSRERRDQTLVEESFTSHLTTLKVEKRFQPFDLGLSFHYRFRDYIDSFNEQDTDIYGAALKIDLYPFSQVKIAGAYQFEQAIAAGRDILFLAPQPSFNDISSLSHQFWIEPEVKIHRSLIAGVLYEFKHRRFITDHTNDFNHYSRKDQTHTIGVNFYYLISRAIEAKFTYERTWRTTNLKPQFYAYDENSYILGIHLFF